MAVKGIYIYISYVLLMDLSCKSKIYLTGFLKAPDMVSQDTLLFFLILWRVHSGFARSFSFALLFRPMIIHTLLSPRCRQLRFRADLPRPRFSFYIYRTSSTPGLIVELRFSFKWNSWCRLQNIDFYPRTLELSFTTVNKQMVLPSFFLKNLFKRPMIKGFVDIYLLMEGPIRLPLQCHLLSHGSFGFRRWWPHGFASFLTGYFYSSPFLYLLAPLLRISVSNGFIFLLFLSLLVLCCVSFYVVFLLFMTHLWWSYKGTWLFFLYKQQTGSCVWLQR